MDTVCIGEKEVRQASYDDQTQLANRVDNDGTYDIGMEDDFANDVGGSGYQKINSVLKVVEEISRETR
jgi:hypothetical protein